MRLVEIREWGHYALRMAAYGNVRGVCVTPTNLESRKRGAKDL